MSGNRAQSTLEGVPKQFINSLRVLFDILDEERTGFVRLTDIETRWKDDDINGLPKGVVDALRKVTPASGRLTFERFVAGLKIALLRTKVPEETIGVRKPENVQSAGQRPDLLMSHTSHGPSQTEYNSGIATIGGVSGSHGNHGYYPGQGHQDMRSSHRGVPPQQQQHDPAHFSQSQRSQHGPTTATVRPNNAQALAQQRTKSMPHLGHGGVKGPTHPAYNNYDMGGTTGIQSGNVPSNPAQDPLSQSARQPGLRHEPASTGRLGWSQSQAQNGAIQHAGKNKDEIVNALKQWQRDRMVSDDADDVTASRPAFQKFTGPAAGPIDKRPLSIASTSAFEHFGRDPLLRSEDDPSDPLSAAANRRAARRKEPRRHTLANGIDYNMIKRMKQLEQEKDVLLQGLEAVERARDWYHAQIRGVQDKQKYVGKSSSHNDYSVEAHQERMNFQQARIYEVNQQLKALVDSSEKGFPLHMNLALSQRVQASENPIQRRQHAENTETSNIVAMLKGQNRLLTQEVSQKSDKISQLEREKATLIRDMFETRSKNRNNNYEDTTFM